MTTSFKRRSIRLKDFDYRNPGAYFVTICVKDGACLFGEIRQGEMWLNSYGEAVQREWMKTELLRSNVRLDQFVIMPDHFHGIICLIETECRGTARRAPTPEKFGHPIQGSLPTIVRSFKSAVTHTINQMRNTPGAPVWQQNYYERVIRDDNELDEIRQYIQENPLKRDLDPGHPCPH